MEIKELVKQYNDVHYNLFEELSQITAAIEREIGASVVGVSGNEVHVYSDIWYVAQKYKVPLQYQQRNSSHYPVKAYFVYNGFTFFQLIPDLDNYLTDKE